MPRRAKPEPADIETPPNGADPPVPPAPPPPGEDSGALLPVPVTPTNGELALAPRLPEDPGLYAILGLDPSVYDIEIQTTTAAWPRDS